VVPALLASILSRASPPSPCTSIATTPSPAVRPGPIYTPAPPRHCPSQAKPSQAEHKKHHTFHTTIPASRDQQDHQHVLLQRQLRVRLRLQVRRLLRRVGTVVPN
jgi:hypothetical protein